MRSSGLRRTAKRLLDPAEIAALYEWHSHRSTAVNEVLNELRHKLDAAYGTGTLPGLWDDAVRQSRLSMWLHQVLAFREALDLFVGWARRTKTARRRTAGDGPYSRTARTVYHEMTDLRTWLGLDSDSQFQLECEVAPRHFVWRDAWAHHGGRLRAESPEVFFYFEDKQAIEELAGVAYPLDNAWSEARRSFSKSIELLLNATGRI